jgi:hypothetical protein
VCEPFSRTEDSERLEVGLPEELQGWHPDPFRRHEWRYFSAGRPTFLVRDGYVEGSDPVENISAPAGPSDVETQVEPAEEWLAPQVPSPRQHLDGVSDDGVSDVAAPAVQPERSAQPDVAPASRRYATRTSHVPFLAVAAVVFVVGVVVLAVTATRHRPSSATVSSPTSVSSATGSASPASSPLAFAGVRVAASGGHFAARFPSTPVQQSVNETVAGVQAMIRAAVVRSPLTEVIEEDLAVAVPTNQQSVVLRSAITVAAATATAGSPTQQTDTTFRGNPARTSTFASPSGEQVTAIAFFQDPRTVYFLLADAGAPIQALSTSLELESASSPSLVS